MGAKPRKTPKKATTTDVTVVLDRSGSMAFRKADTIGAFNEFLKEQRKLKDKCHFTFIQFDDEYEAVFEGDIQNCSFINDDTYVPRGSTALFDAVNRAISGADTRKATNRVVVVITDGEENSSREVTMAKLSENIKARQGKGWEFLFLGTALEEWDHQTQALFAMSNLPTQNFYTSRGQSVNSTVRSASAYTTSTRDLGTAPVGTSWLVKDDDDNSDEVEND